MWCWDCSINTKLSRLGFFHFPFSAVSPDFIFGSAGMPWATPYPLALFWFITPTHTHTHTLCKVAFIRVVMPVKSKTDNWRVPGVYKNNKHKHEVCNNIRWHASIVFWCGFAGKLDNIRMFENTRVQNQNNTAMFRSPRVWRCVGRTIRVKLTPGALSLTPLCINKCIQTMKCIEMRYIHVYSVFIRDAYACNKRRT